MEFWWVNQNQSYREERAAGILWAPRTTKNGRLQAHWEAMTRVQLGDRILHYADQHVQAVSAVTAAAVDCQRPSDLPEKPWGTDGRLVRCTYADAHDPVFREEIPTSWRNSEPGTGPFRVDLAVKQGYLFPLTRTLGEEFLRTFEARFPPIPTAAGTTPPDASDSAANILRRLLGTAIKTPGGRRNWILAVEPSRVLVATERSPEGKWVPLDEVDRALQQLNREGSVSVDPESLGHRSSFVGAVLLTLPGAIAGGTPPTVSFNGPREVPAAGFDGPLSVPGTVLLRGEQGRLRRLLFGNAAEADCAICGRRLPVRFLVAAHIKKRSLCSEEERRHLPYIAMPACSLGCDSLFEAGYLAVDEFGIVRKAPGSHGEALDSLLGELDGRHCSSFSPDSANYFDWHRRNTLRS